MRNPYKKSEPRAGRNPFDESESKLKMKRKPITRSGPCDKRNPH